MFGGGALSLVPAGGRFSGSSPSRATLGFTYIHIHIYIYIYIYICMLGGGAITCPRRWTFWWIFALPSHPWIHIHTYTHIHIYIYIYACLGGGRDHLSPQVDVLVDLRPPEPPLDSHTCLYTYTYIYIILYICMFEGGARSLVPAGGRFGGSSPSRATLRAGRRPVHQDALLLPTARLREPGHPPQAVREGRREHFC